MSAGMPGSERGAARPRVGPVNYSDRIAYRRPPRTYVRLTGAAAWLAPALGLAPRDVVRLDTRGRRTGARHRVLLVRVSSEGSHYLVALAGESEWVRNVRAANGIVVVGRRRLHAATLIELPVTERAPIIRAYLDRWGRQSGSRALASEAVHYFGVSADASLQEIGQVAKHYPVFRVDYTGVPDTKRGWWK